MPSKRLLRGDSVAGNLCRMQALFEIGEEMGDHEGLGLLRAQW